MSSKTYEKLHQINPYRLWEVITYDNIGGYDNHAYECFDCFGYLHYANKYNILIASMATDSIANTSVLNS
jgi:hypothetical protein